MHFEGLKIILESKNSKMKVFATGLVAAAMAAPEAPQQATPLSIGSPAIIGGKNASDGQFPWQVTLARSSGSHYCGGSILAPTKVKILSPIIHFRIRLSNIQFQLSEK